VSDLDPYPLVGTSICLVHCYYIKCSLTSQLCLLLTDLAKPAGSFRPPSSSTASTRSFSWSGSIISLRVPFIRTSMLPKWFGKHTRVPSNVIASRRGTWQEKHNSYTTVCCIAIMADPSYQRKECTTLPYFLYHFNWQSGRRSVSSWNEHKLVLVGIVLVSYTGIPMCPS